MKLYNPKYIFYGIAVIFLCLFTSYTNVYPKSLKDKNQVSSRSALKNESEYNVVFIIFDSIREDHLGCYGYPKNTSPVIDELAGEGILFEQAISNSSWSLPAHCSIFTSKYVPAHGVNSTNNKLAEAELTLAEILKVHDYKTAAFTGGFWLDSVFNIGQGFDVYHDELILGKLKDTVPLAVNWLRKNKDNKFFLLLQGFDGHSPFKLTRKYKDMYADPDYNGVFKTALLDHRIGDRIAGDRFYLDYEYKNNVKVTTKDIEYIISQYDGSVSCADQYLGKFLQHLEQLNLKENTIIILTSYHGTPLFEQGIILRRYQGGGAEGVVRVPLIIRHPGFKKQQGKRIQKQVQHIDIMPTILEFMKIPLNHQAQGKSFLPLIEGTGALDFNKYAYSTGYKEMFIRTQDWKLIEIVGRGAELYNLKQDPKEQNNLINQEREIADRLSRKLDKWYNRVKADLEKTDKVPRKDIEKIKDEMIEAGYWFLSPSRNKKVKGRYEFPQGHSLIKEAKNR